ncbi:AMP-binding protein [Pseudodesulfovibrio sediminis]|uniref:Long-chain-fatty-acid--CoA ligase n=1 Tax=Pseudodesulfovibrio sediminis TaxID=2810563 RepID=A0ABN6EUB1_9BACT|nr:AMP-binding protein [Pseudodesulfovibrio sediminis]BCS88453.1 hypothetical protein PSDVSF_16950 [Pseudodesulfovibrio sediminis]
MDALSLTASDIQEMLSSLLMAQLSYDSRMQFAKGASLPAHFVPSPDTIPDFDSALKTIGAMFHAPQLDNTDTASLAELTNALFEHWRDNGDKITFFTSGSTGAPKPSTHDYDLHVQETIALAEIFRDRKRIVSYVPRHHIYGFLFSILLPKVMGVEVRWEAPQPFPGMTSSLRDGDLIVAFPLLWEKLTEMHATFGHGLHGATSTGPCSAQVITSLKAHGLDRMYEIYGSSETGGIGYRTSPQDNYTLLPHWKKTDSDSVLLRPHSDEDLHRYELQDLLKWQKDTFIPERRTDNAVQVAGINVYPSRVRAALLEHPDVDDCAVRLMRPDEGQRLKIFIVLAKNAQEDMDASLRKWAKERLSPHEQPMIWTFGPKLPVNSLGKQTDW